ncbi:hypothetical protein FH972_012994 [Carpinus fangiana]|uniref:Uncharacterized protein n=1 Tax=Carpinus fangiana TaxID=176857 RepID=A0A5N6R711_9ROSI|nr:hypothetical protein FH972_012994 [Carpinus fangiana]
MSLPNPSSPFLETKPLKKTSFTTSDADTHDSFLEQDNEHDDGEILGVILGRSNPRLSAYFHKQPTSALDQSSGSSASTRTISMRLSDKRGSVESAVRRAFSVRVSAPVVSEDYHRIDHRCNSDEDGVLLIAADARRRTRTNKRKGGNIFEACRRLLGF